MKILCVVEGKMEFSEVPIVVGNFISVIKKNQLSLDALILT